MGMKRARPEGVAKRPPSMEAHLAVDMAMPGAQELAQSLVGESLAAGSQDNVSAIVVDIKALPEDLLDDVLAASTRLSVPPLLKVGDVLDGFRVLEILRAHTAKANAVAEETLYLAKQAMKLDFGRRTLGFG